MGRGGYVYGMKGYVCASSGKPVNACVYLVFLYIISQQGLFCPVCWRLGFYRSFGARDCFHTSVCRTAHS